MKVPRVDDHRYLLHNNQLKLSHCFKNLYKLLILITSLTYTNLNMRKSFVQVEPTIRTLCKSDLPHRPGT